MTIFENYLVGLGIMYTAVLIKNKIAQRNLTNSKDPKSHEPFDGQNPLFRRFQREFLIVFLVMISADWMQGPYVYQLYNYYGFDRQANGLLFIAGFGSSLIFGTWAGPIADLYGRRFACVLYGVTYTLSCLTKHVNNFEVLMLGRVLGGIATSILWSAFESWMVAEHTSRGFHPDTLSSTFSLMTTFNGFVAILSGFIAQYAVDAVGHPVAPFDVSALFLVSGTVFIRFTWPENYGSVTKGVMQQMNEAIGEVWKDSRIALVGCQQALFEGAMYTFVFMWTPALDGAGKIPHGLIFSCFMIACSLGGTIFGNMIIPANIVLLFVFLGSSIAMCVPILTAEPVYVMGSFVVFEILVGLFWPAIGTMRSKVIPEHCRATVMNLFRVPLNIIVCLVLYFQGSMDVAHVFLFCSVFHFAAFGAAVVLYRKMQFDAPNAARTLDA